MEMTCFNHGFFMRRRSQAEGEVAPDQIIAMLNFDGAPMVMVAHVEAGEWDLALDSSDPKWGGPGSLAPTLATPGQEIQVEPHSFLVYRRRVSNPN